MARNHGLPQQSAKHSAQPAAPEITELSRSLTLPLVVLYGLGVTIGAGIYVLLGATSGVAGVYAPLSFVLAALVMLPSSCAFAELVGRHPLSAGEAAYVNAGFNSRSLAVLIGLMVVAVGTVSAAAISVGSVGYIRQFLDLPDAIMVPAVVIAMTFIAAWGVKESVTFAAVMTLIEIGGLLIIIAGGLFSSGAPPVNDAAPLAGAAMPAIAFGIISGGVLAFFAFIGFEDLVNMAEETERPAITLPRAIFLTLIISTTLYVAVSVVAILNVPVRELATSEAPLSLVFERTTGASPQAISAIAIVATLNGVIVQIIMGARVVYGLARQGSLPAILGSVNPWTRTPLVASALIGATVYLLATAVPLRGLAETTSLITLTVFAAVNLALFNIKRRGDPPPEGTFIVPIWVPIAGFLSCCFFFVSAFL